MVSNQNRLRLYQETNFTSYDFFEGAFGVNRLTSKCLDVNISENININERIARTK